MTTSPRSLISIRIAYLQADVIAENASDRQFVDIMENFIKIT